jgi:hypothetical protein
VVAIKRELQGFPAGTQAAVVDVMTVPRLGYNLEVVLNSGYTAGVIFGVDADDVELVLKADGSKP